MTWRTIFLFFAGLFMVAAGFSILGWIEHLDATALALFGVGLFFWSHLP